MAEIGAIILAAGRSSRYRAEGGEEVTKLVALLDGAPIVRRVAAAALQSRARPIVAVVGHARAEVEAALAGLPLLFVENPDYASGLASSLRVGLRAMPASAAGALVLLGDMPRIDATLIDTLIAAFLQRPGAVAAAPIHTGRRGNPALLGRALFGPAHGLPGDEGARRLLNGVDPALIVEVPAPDAGVAFDVDTPGDLAAARAAPKT